MGPVPKQNEAEELRAEVISELPNGATWLVTPHELLGGLSPEQKMQHGGISAVRDLVYSILYVGIV